jgi:hypothetical protein
MLASIALSIFFVAGRWFSVCGELYSVLYDDAMISMRYARNLAEGHGLVWNPGGAPVEGYTNFLWTLWMAVLHLSGVPDAKMALLVSASGALILVLNLLVLRAVARRLVPEALAVTTLVLWLVSLCLPLVYWTLVGLEVGLLALLTSLAMLLVLRLTGAFRRRDLILLAAVLAAAVLVRTDQVVLCAVVLAFLGLRLPPEHRARALLILGLVLAVTLGGHTAFRLTYYGDPLPNAYYLKVAGVSARVRLTRGVGALGVSGVEMLFVPVALAVVALWPGASRRRRDVILPIAVFLGTCAYSVLVGGDAWEEYPVPNRYLTAGLPALLLASAVGAWRLSTLEAKERRRLVGAMAVGLGFAAGAEYWARVMLRGPHAAGPDGGVSIWVPENVRWWALTLVFTLLLGMAAMLGRGGASRAGAPELPPWRPLACGAVVLVAANAASFTFVLRPTPSAPDLSTPARLTRLAVTVRDTTKPDASMAVVWAGIIPYFARRPAVDLLGRSDRTVARMAPRTERFWPGHTKWDYEHSIGRLRPDLIVQLWQPTPEELAAIRSFGYDQLAPEIFVRADSVAVDRRAFEEALHGQPGVCPRPAPGAVVASRREARRHAAPRCA